MEKDGIGYYADYHLLRLTPFPSARRGGASKTLRKKLQSNIFVLCYIPLQINLRDIA